MHKFYVINKKILLSFYNLPIEKCVFLWYNTSEEKERKDGKVRWEDDKVPHKNKERKERSDGRLIIVQDQYHKMKGRNTPMRA